MSPPSLADLVAAGTASSRATARAGAVRRAERRAAPPSARGEEGEASTARSGTVRVPTRPFAVLVWRGRGYVATHGSYETYAEAEAAGARAFAKASRHGAPDLFVPVDVERYVEREGDLPDPD